MGSALGEFLAARRARVRPDDATAGSPRRRVPGLRREEVAHAAAVSTSYYTSLEQGRVVNVSAEVLHGIARALRLDEAETTHLERLAAHLDTAPPAGGPLPAEVADPALLRVLSSVEVPACVFGRTTDVLAWNALGHALLAPDLPFDSPEDPDRRPNHARRVFGELRRRHFFADWERHATTIVGALRQLAGHHPDDRRLHATIDGLLRDSPDFRRMWTEHHVQPCRSAEAELQHPTAGRMVLTRQPLFVADVVDQQITVFTPVAGSEEAVDRLRAAIRTGRRPA